MKSTRAFITAGVAGLAALGAAGTASAAAPSAPRWHIVKTVKGGDAAGEFTEVVATGKSTAWAFQELGNEESSSVAWELSGDTWTKKAFPAKAGETIGSAAASSPSDVWAVTALPTGASRVMRFNGHTWSAVKTFQRNAGEVAVRAVNDVWLFGQDGVIHYNGRAWTRVGPAVWGGSVRSDRDVWAFTGTVMDHWNGRGWTATSLRSLLPKPNQFRGAQLADVLALSATNVYATGDSDTMDAGGPITVLHFDGRKWTRVAQSALGGGGEMSPDGRGGLWITHDLGEGAGSVMLHYAGGKLTTVAFPGNSRIWTISRVPGSTEQLGGGDLLVPGHAGTGGAMIFLYS